MYIFSQNTRCNKPFIRKKMAWIVLVLIFFVSPQVYPQSSLYQQYIEKYKDVAVKEMQRYGIPASITLAQGLLESGAGTSVLAVKANNHFGIKTGGTWTGPYYVKDDDAPDERFRAYKSALESYEDHSLFLKNRSRYASLFMLSPTDYKGWAYGLKAAGYATNPEYANKLISIIEIYNLHQYDSGKTSPLSASDHTRNHRAEKTRHNHHEHHVAKVKTHPEVKICNGKKYIIARNGDTFESIAENFRKKPHKLYSYNEVPESIDLQEGNIVFLQKKSSHADSNIRGKIHEVKAGESLHTISQRYAITLKSLYKKNSLKSDYIPRVGDKLILP